MSPPLALVGGSGERAKVYLNGISLMKHSRFLPWLGLFLFLCATKTSGVGAVPLDLSAYDSSSEIRVESGSNLLNVRWRGSQGIYCELVFSLFNGAPLVKSVGTMERALDPAMVILRDINPVTLLTVGERDLEKRRGWNIFFDKVHAKPSKTSLMRLDLESVRVTSTSGTASVEFAEVNGGDFSGTLRFSFSSGSSLVRVEAIVSTTADARAILYDAGVTCADPSWRESVWIDSSDRLTRTMKRQNLAASSRSVRYRTIVAEGALGSLALFPPPHQFFYPLDFADNFGFVWHGPGYRNQILQPSIGIRQPLEGDRRYVPWFNAPPRSQQRLSIYWYITPGKGKDAIDEVARYTRRDRYEPLPGYQRFTSHYHIEHTLDYLKQTGGNAGADVPSELESPGFVQSFKRIGADIVHLAEFHNGRTPRLPTKERLDQLHLMHAECERLSDDSFLLLPGEEPNVHLGGHWLSFFPRPVNWVLQRPKGVPFAQEVAGHGTVYHVGSRDDVFELMKREGGLMWTAHARIKGSTGYPDRYREQPFFQSERFLGAAWKAMPADLSVNRLGTRVLDLLDNMANWGERKYVLGEVDVFKVEPNYELYGHMNMNYVRLDRLPNFEQGWGALLQALREGRFFVTTGEVLIKRFVAGTCESGETLRLKPGERQSIEFDLDWTFPLAFAEIVSGDGQHVYRETVDLGQTREFGQGAFRRSLDLSGRTWVRLEVWDTAANGAFTQPIWIDGLTAVEE